MTLFLFPVNIDASQASQRAEALAQKHDIDDNRDCVDQQLDRHHCQNRQNSHHDLRSS
jgi:hypothetical protein